MENTSNQPDPATFPLAAFEHYMAADDSEDYPMNLLWKLDFAGNIDGEKFKHSLDQALSRHPLLRSKISNSPQNPLKSIHWIPSQSPEVPIYWREDSWGALVGAVQPLDIQNELPIKVHVLRKLDSAEALFQFHHSATDGQGVVSFLEDFFAIYSGATPLRDFCKNAMEFRQTFGLSLADSLKRIPREIVHATESIIQPAQEVGVPESADSEEPYFPFRGAVWRAISPVALMELKKYSHKSDVTLNDLFLREYFMAIDGWNRRYSGKSKRIRVSMPVNLRFQNDKLPASNVVSMCFLNRKPSLFSDRQSLLGSISKETKYLRKHRLGLTLVRSIQLMSKLRFGHPYNAGGAKACHATGVLTNLGMVFKDSDLPKNSKGKIQLSDDLSLNDVTTFPPLRPNTHLTLGVITYGGQVNLCLSFNRARLTRGHAESLLQDMIDGFSSLS